MNKLCKINKIIRVILIAIPILTFIWLLDKNCFFSDSLKVVYKFDKNSPVISILKPAGRVLKIEQDKSGDYWQKMIIDPVYFSLYLPTTKFKNAEFIFVFQKPENQIIKIGPQIFNDSWGYYLEELKCEKTEGEWCIGKLNFDLSKTYIKDRKINFMISAPNLDKSGEFVKISQINLKLE
ncbi:MAG: hypothetical protein U9O66_02650 [Patescibacteria group bacterium]|nr:hypothetical protein [Patescibacteria group bacterium]